MVFWSLSSQVIQWCSHPHRAHYTSSRYTFDSECLFGWSPFPPLVAWVVQCSLWKLQIIG